MCQLEYIKTWFQVKQGFDRFRKCFWTGLTHLLNPVCLYVNTDIYIYKHSGIFLIPLAKWMNPNLLHSFNVFETQIKWMQRKVWFLFVTLVWWSDFGLKVWLVCRKYSHFPVKTSLHIHDIHVLLAGPFRCFHQGIKDKRSRKSCVDDLFLR